MAYGVGDRLFNDALQVPPKVRRDRRHVRRNLARHGHGEARRLRCAHRAQLLRQRGIRKR